jgi:hypothetical protein
MTSRFRARSTFSSASTATCRSITGATMSATGEVEGKRSALMLSFVGGFVDRRQLPRTVSAFIAFAVASVRELGLLQPETQTRRVA